MKPSPENRIFFERVLSLAIRELAASLAASLALNPVEWAADNLREDLSFAANEYDLPAPGYELPLADLQLQAAQVLVSLLSRCKV